MRVPEVRGEPKVVFSKTLSVDGDSVLENRFLHV